MIFHSFAVTTLKRLSSGCNLGKDLRAREEESKLVKRKEYSSITTLLIDVELPQVAKYRTG